MGGPGRHPSRAGWPAPSSPPARAALPLPAQDRSMPRPAPSCPRRGPEPSRVGVRTGARRASRPEPIPATRLSPSGRGLRRRVSRPRSHKHSAASLSGRSRSARIALGGASRSQAFPAGAHIGHGPLGSRGWLTMNRFSTVSWCLSFCRQVEASHAIVEMRSWMDDTFVPHARRGAMPCQGHNHPPAFQPAFRDRVFRRRARAVRTACPRF